MLWCLESQSRVREKHNPSNRAVGWSACARKLFFSYKSVKTRPHMRLTDMISEGVCQFDLVLAAFHTCSDESGSAGMLRVPELRVTWEQGVRLVVQGGYPFVLLGTTFERVRSWQTTRLEQKG